MVCLCFQRPNYIRQALRELHIHEFLRISLVHCRHIINVNSFVNVTFDVQCASNIVKSGSACSPKRCARVIVDDLFSTMDIDNLHIIANKGMSQRISQGGPTILDINTGYIRDSDGIENLFHRDNDIYSSSDFSNYAEVINRLKGLVEDRLHVSDVHFTAPTFITRLDGRDSWEPSGVHDEYWHVHADKNNTAHYYFSGLLYMSDFERDFTGGRLVFLSSTDDETVEQVVEPRRGRIALFTSGAENPHYVERVTSGQRFVLAFWFTCDPARAFPVYLDGRAHVAFSHKIRDKDRVRREKASAKDL